MNPKKIIRSQEGFTLVEIIAVLIILGILAAVAVPRYIDLETNAKNRAIDAGVSELNGRESLVWADAKISGSPFDDATINTHVQSRLTPYDLNPPNTPPGQGYEWSAAPTSTGGTLKFKGGTGIDLTREPSNLLRPGSWRRTSP